MATISRFDPPALLSDFDGIAQQRDGWSRYISSVFDGAIADVENDVGSGRCQFFNQTKAAPATMVERNVLWNAFPRTLVERHGRALALKMADELEAFNSPFGPTESRIQDEYCEWRVTRDSATQKITRVTFTCEGPEYWQSIAGGPSIYADRGESPADFGAPGDPELLLQLYRNLLETNAVQLDDLYFTAPNGERFYNPWNPWNTTRGIVHLQQINNTLGAEIHIGADATVLRKKGNQPVNDATRLICCSGYGGPERSSDPSLGFEVNKLSAEGRRLTLRNPVGIYMDRLDTTGWSIPNPAPGGPRLPVGNWWRLIRGIPDAAGQPSSGMVVRAVYEVPAGVFGPNGVPVTVSDIQIGGIAITQGGQIAEKITMKFVALAGPPNELVNPRFDCSTKCCNSGGVLRIARLSDFCQDVFPSSAAPTMLASAAAGVPRISTSRCPVDE